MFTKYPRTFHFPWSPGRSDDDKVLQETSCFLNRHVVVTEKMDGENSTLYPGGKIHARSIDSSSHPSRDWLKKFWSERCHNLGDDMRVCGENLYAKHSIGYDSLSSYFMGFSVWDRDTCLSWEETLLWFAELDIVPVKTIYNGIYDEDMLTNFQLEDGMEGYVVRLADHFNFNEFGKSVAKFVRKNHVQTDKHWMFSKIEKNRLKDKIMDKEFYEIVANMHKEVSERPWDFV